MGETIPQPEKQTLKLSDAYEKKLEAPELELTVTVYNINCGYNDEIMDACRTLKEYAMYVEQVRNYAKQMQGIEQSLKKIVTNMVKHNVPDGDICTYTGCKPELIDAVRNGMNG